jgi:hypothetical protein
MFYLNKINVLLRLSIDSVKKSVGTTGKLAKIMKIWRPGPAAPSYGCDRVHWL